MQIYGLWAETWRKPIQTQGEHANSTKRQEHKAQNYLSNDAGGAWVIGQDSDFTTSQQEVVDQATVCIQIKDLHKGV